MKTGELYDRANAGLNEILFSGRYEYRPVYFNLDEDAKKTLAQTFNEQENQIENFIAKIVGSQLNNNGDPYRAHVNRAQNWKKDNCPGRPPFSAILFALSYAAGLMANDGHISSGNYYKRLSQIFDVRRKRLSAYGKSTEIFWRLLNRWLTENDYEYGRPTARPMNAHKYVGYPQSQVVVRDGDRRQFHHLFNKYGFSGNENFSNEEIETYLQNWILSSAPNSRLKSAWAKTEFKPAFCSVVLAELEAWSQNMTEGASGTASPTSNQNLSLLLAVTDTFLQPSLSLLLGRSTVISDPIENLKRDGTQERLCFSNNVYGGFASLSPNVVQRTNDALFHEIRILDEAGSRKFTWRPRLIIPFTSTLAGPYSIEVSRVGVTTSHEVLVRDDSSVREKVDRYLMNHSDQQARVATEAEIKGIPVGWVLYRDVCIRPHNEDVDNKLEALRPLGSGTGLMFEGGMSLGQGIWHAGIPPSLQMISPRKSYFSLSVYELGQEDGEPLLNEKGERIEAVKLQELGIGEYTIRGGSTANESGLNLRSADKPRPRKADQISYSYYSLTGAEDITRENDDKPRVEGLKISGLQSGLGDYPSLEVKNCELPDFEEDWEDEDAPKAKVGLTSVQKSCIDRGYHYWICETLRPGHPRTTPLNMECKDCKESVLTKKRGRNSRTKKQKPKPTPRWEKDNNFDMNIDFNIFFDGLCYLGMGNRARFERLLSSFSQQPRSMDAIAHNLSALGFLDLKLRQGSGRFENWSIPSPSFHFVDQDKAIFSGFRSSRLIKAIEWNISEIGGRLCQRKLPDQPEIITIEGLGFSDLREKLAKTQDPLGRPIHIIEDASRLMTSALGSLPGIDRSFKTISPGCPENIKKFDVDSGKWRHTDSLTDPGAYRFFYAGPTYVFRGKSGNAFSGPYQWVKTLAAKSMGRRLHSYDSTSKQFQSALGVEPIGLLSRALICSTGKLPTLVKKQEGKKLVFSDVAANIANVVLYNLYHRNLSL